jgi:hypothetical protein
MSWIHSIGHEEPVHFARMRFVWCLTEGGGISGFLLGFGLISAAFKFLWGLFRIKQAYFALRARRGV